MTDSSAGDLVVMATKEVLIVCVLEISDDKSSACDLNVMLLVWVEDDGVGDLSIEA